MWKRPDRDFPKFDNNHFIKCYEAERDSLKLSINKNFVNYAGGQTKSSIFSSENDIPKWNDVKSQRLCSKKARHNILERYAMNLTNKNITLLYVVLTL